VIPWQYAGAIVAGFVFLGWTLIWAITWHRSVAWDRTQARMRRDLH
jgi:hypothetical protein